MLADVYFISPVGLLRLIASEGFLTGIQFTHILGPTQSESAVLQMAVEQLKAYFSGKLKTFTVPLNLQGTQFQKQVWEALRQIPFGQVVSYKDIADAIGHPKAIRAVGQANGRNPIPIIVPCHRVILANGKLGGYSSGVLRKRWLLEHEGIKIG